MFSALADPAKRSTTLAGLLFPASLAAMKARTESMNCSRPPRAISLTNRSQFVPGATSSIKALGSEKGKSKAPVHERVSRSASKAANAGRHKSCSTRSDSPEIWPQAAVIGFFLLGEDVKSTPSTRFAVLTPLPLRKTFFRQFSIFYVVEPFSMLFIEFPLSSSEDT